MRTLKIPAPLDPAFRPIAFELREFRSRAHQAGNSCIEFALERNSGLVARRSLPILPEGVDDSLNLQMAERLFKTMLWVYGGFRCTISGSKTVFEGLKKLYVPGAHQGFDAVTMGNVYDHPFEILYCENPADLPAEKEMPESVGGHLEGCRIGFDAGGSDRKVSAVVNGETVYSEEVVWFPKTNSDPQYHFDGIVAAMKTAASKMPRVDAIGVSSAGIYIDNQTRLASLFLKLSPEDFDRYARDIYIRAAKEIGNVPLVVCNDGDVTALAGAMSLNENSILGIAMGTSEAAGYVDPDGNIKGWLNELAFVPCDLAPDAMRDEWSGDIGCGVKYFSQDGVIKLAPAAGIVLDENASPAEKLKTVQSEMEKGNPNAARLYETIGVYLGYTLAYYAEFYQISKVLLMGRVTSGKGGDIVLAKANEVLQAEFPELAMQVMLPDEKARRVGQSVAAASLPKI